MDDPRAWMVAFAKALGVDPSAFVAGLFGSFISFKFVSELGIFGRAATFVGGVAFSTFLSPPIAGYFKFGPEYYGGIGLIVGVFAMGVVAAILKALRDADLWAFIRSRFGGGGGQ